MVSNSKIQWTNATWNPVVGCTKVSPGCLNCYAERMAGRLACMGQEKYSKVVEWVGGEHPVNSPAGVYYCQKPKGWNGKTYCDEKSLEIPLHWRQPRMIFVCSMGDLFHPSVPFSFVSKVCDTILECQQHTFQILTKRPERMRDYILDADITGDYTMIEDNVWLGVTVCTPDEKHKIDTLRQIPASVRYLSIEPCLADMGELNLEGIDWVIVGGESGLGARPMHPDWARGIRDQCVAAGVPFFFKQWGRWMPQTQLSALKPIYLSRNGIKYDCYWTQCQRMVGVGKKKAGRLLDGKVWDEYPKGGE